MLIRKEVVLHYLKKIYHRSPYFAIKAVRTGYKIWDKIRNLWVPVHLYKGVTVNGIENLYFAYLGWNFQIENYWLDFIYKHYEIVGLKGKVPAWNLNRYLNSSGFNCDLAIIELSGKVIDKNLDKTRGIVIPRWMKTFIDIELTLSKSKHIRDIGRMIRKHSFMFEKGSSETDFEYFYHKLYKPYVKSRHKEAAVVEDYKLMLRNFMDTESDIYFVTRNGIRIAGVYLRNIENVPYMYALGILNASEELMRNGVISALYYYVIDSQRENASRRIDVGGCSPFLDDGVTCFKLRLGAKVSDISRQDSVRLMLLPAQNTPAVVDFLSTHPFVFIEDQKIFYGIFKNGKSDHNLESRVLKLIADASARNLEGIKVFEFRHDNELSKKLISPSVIAGNN
jgi:hypothetical protein